VRVRAPWQPAVRLIFVSRAGEIELAIASFETALRLEPEGMAEVREDELPSARLLLQKKQAMVAAADAQFLSGHLARDRSDLPERGHSTAARLVLENGRVCLSALPPSQLFRPEGMATCNPNPR